MVFFFLPSQTTGFTQFLFLWMANYIKVDNTGCVYLFLDFQISGLFLSFTYFNSKTFDSTTMAN